MKATGDPSGPTSLCRNHLRGAVFTSSVAKEAATMQPALEWATANHPEHSLTVCTDSQSLIKATKRRSPVAHHQRSRLNAQPGPTTRLWVPEHKGTSGNELADTAARTATTTT